MNEHTKQHDEKDQPSGGVRVVSRSGNNLVLEVYGDAANCLDGVTEEEPAVYFDWHLDTLAEAVKLANNDRAHLELPAWMAGCDYPIKVRIV